MTPDDERLAPVTSLFGRRAGSKPVSHPVDGEAGARPASDRPNGGGEPAWPDEADAAPGADEGGWADHAARGDERVVRSESPVDGTRVSGRGARAGRDAHPAGTGQVDGERHKLVALPTFAAFASKGDVDDPTDEGENDSESGIEPEPEPETSEAARDRAENISMHALTRRGVSSSEMAKTLRSRDLPEDIVLDEVDRLERVGLLDDGALAENLVRSKQERKGLGKSAINAELRQRGLAQEAIDSALAEIDDDDEQTRADDWATKRAGQMRGLDHETAQRRLTAFLLRRGYRSEVARRAIDKALPRGGSGGGASSRGGSFGGRSPRGGSSSGGVRFD